jgi:hypothetical protein
MSFVLTNLAVMTLATMFFWWLSGFDSRLTDEDKLADFIHRGLRCAVSLVLVEISFVYLWQYATRHDPTAGFTYVMVAMPLAVIWCGCLSHLGAHAFNWAIDPEDKRAYDPRTEVRLLDGIAELIRTGKTAEAIRVCETLKISGEVNVATLELVLEHLGVPQKNGRIVKPLTEADRLRSLGNFSEAELILHSLLLNNPRDMDAAMLLIRLYAQDMHQPMSAKLVLATLEKQPHMTPAHLEFARRSIEEWTNPRSPEPAQSLPSGSVDELLAQRYIGTAIETLQEQIKAQPQDFALRMKLAEVQVVHCKNLPLAEKIVKQMEGTFSREQIQFAGTKLKEWREMVK